MALDRLAAAWESFEALRASERREFLRWLRDWHLARRIEAIEARGGKYDHRPKSLAEVSAAELAAALDRAADPSGLNSTELADACQRWVDECGKW